MRTNLLVALLSVLVIGLVIFAGCDSAKDQAVTSPNGAVSNQLLTPGGGGPPPPKPTYDVPTLVCASSTPTTISVTVTAGASGAPAGFSLHWMTAADYAANGNSFNSNALSYCGASYSGNAANSYFKLLPNQSITITIGAIQWVNGTIQLSDGSNGFSRSCFVDFPCASDYVFEVFAHADGNGNQSGKSLPTFCSSSACAHEESDGGCTYTQGYWKNHGGAQKQQKLDDNLWPTDALALGNHTYTQADLLNIFNTPVRGNGYVSLAHQLIAAKLNVANGADASVIADVIADADGFIGSTLIPDGGVCSTSAVNEWVKKLDDWNNGVTGPGHCE